MQRRTSCPPRSTSRTPSHFARPAHQADATTSSRASKSRRSMTPIFKSCRGGCRGTWVLPCLVKETSARRWRVERNGCWCAWRGCRVSGWKREALRSELAVNSRADIHQRLTARRHPAREHRFAHADVAEGAVIGLETGEQRPVPRVLRAVTVAIHAIEGRGGAPRRRVRLQRAGVFRNRKVGEDFRGGDAGPRGRMNRSTRGTGEENHSGERDSRGAGHHPRRLRHYNASSVASTSAP